jgi:ribosomal-protein-alanine N-acetyltransferase
MIRQTSAQLVGRRVLLRPLTPDDYGAWKEVRTRCDSWLTKWEPAPPPGAPDSVKDPRVFAARCGARERERQLGTAFGFGIFVDGRFGGEINVSNIVRGAMQSCTVGYWIDEALAGNGYMPEAMAVIMRFVFEEIGLHRLEAGIIPRNRASRRVVEKLNIRDEGMAERFLQINGVWEDHIRFGITAEEWHLRREAYSADWF